MWSPRTANNGADLRAATQGRPYVTSIFSQFLSYGGRSALPRRSRSWEAGKTVHVHVHVNDHVDVNVGVDVGVEVNGSRQANILSRRARIHCSRVREISV